MPVEKAKEACLRHTLSCMSTTSFDSSPSVTERPSCRPESPRIFLIISRGLPGTSIKSRPCSPSPTF